MELEKLFSIRFSQKVEMYNVVLSAVLCRNYKFYNTRILITWNY